MSLGSSLMHENVIKKEKKVFVSSIEFKPHPLKDGSIFPFSKATTPLMIVL